MLALKYPLHMDVYPSQTTVVDADKNIDPGLEIILESSDEDLMLAYARHGNQDAFEALYTKHKGSLYRYCVRMLGNEALGAELFQDTWSRIIRSREHYKVKAKFKTYLFHVAHNLIIDQWRKNSPDMLSVDESNGVGEILESDINLVEELERAEQMQQFRQAVLELPRNQRDVLMLHYDHGLTLEQIAHIDSIGRETVKSRLRYAVRKLKNALSNQAHNLNTETESVSTEVSND